MFGISRMTQNLNNEAPQFAQPAAAAIAEGFRHLGYKDDHAVNAAEWIVYDALYAYCREMVRQGKARDKFAK